MVLIVGQVSGTLDDLCAQDSGAVSIRLAIVIFTSADKLMTMYIALEYIVKYESNYDDATKYVGMAWPRGRVGSFRLCT